MGQNAKKKRGQSTTPPLPIPPRPKWLAVKEPAAAEMHAGEPRERVTSSL